MRRVVGAVAAVVFVARARDVRLVPSLVVGADGAWRPTLAVCLAASAVFKYERLVARVLPLVGLGHHLPSTLGAMLSLFALLRLLKKAWSPAEAERLQRFLSPGVDFLGKWMGLFLAPPLAALDASLMALPPYGVGVWVKTFILLALGWCLTFLFSAKVATLLRPRETRAAKALFGSRAPALVAAALRAKVAVSHGTIMTQEESTRRAWVFLAAASSLGVCAAGLAPLAPLARPCGMLCELAAAVVAFTSAKLLPSALQPVLHPLVLCAVSANLASRFVGPAAPFFDGGGGVGDLLVHWLPAAVTGLGMRMFATTSLWYDSPGDLRCVLVASGSAGCFSLLVGLLGAVAPFSPLGLPAPLSLPLLHRSVMSALGIEGAHTLGPECDPKLAVAAILTTGCIGASLGKALLAKTRGLIYDASPLVRGIAMGCSAHAIGTSALLAEGDDEAAAVAGAAMCLSGTAHTLLLQLPGLVPLARSMAGI